VSCSVLQSIAVCCTHSEIDVVFILKLRRVAVWCKSVQCVAVCCSVLQCVAVC